MNTMQMFSEVVEEGISWKEKQQNKKDSSESLEIKNVFEMKSRLYFINNMNHTKVSCD